MLMNINNSLGSNSPLTPLIENRFSEKSLPRGRTRRAFLAGTAGLLSALTASVGLSREFPVRTAQQSLRWLAFYGMTADEAVLASYDLVVLDPGYQGSIDLIARTGTKVCGYISLAEIRTSDPFMEALDPAALLPENPDWPGTRRVDVRHPSWTSLVFERIQSLEAQAFTGLMLDTLDTPPYLEQLDPERYRGIRGAAVELVNCIRARCPEMMLIMNRGYALLPDVAHNLDAVIAESLLTSPDQQTGKPAWRDSQQVETQLALLYPAAFRRPGLPILSLDYWDPDDTKTIAEIYRKERAIGHHPYVATRLLDQIVSNSL